MTTNSVPTTGVVAPADALKYSAAILKQRCDWTLDVIGGSGCEYDHEEEIDATLSVVDVIRALADQYGDPNRYSDGRLVQSSAEIQDGLVTTHVWHPCEIAEDARSWRAALPSDPGMPSPGIYEVSYDPVAQDIHVRVVRSV